MFPHNAEVRNKMTVSECRRYINYIADLADRELIDALIRGNQVTWVLFDRDAGRPTFSPQYHHDNSLVY